MITISRARLLAFGIVSIIFLWPIEGVTQSSLVGSWLVTLQGDAETRTLSVTEETQTTDGSMLAARFGMTSRGSAPITARVLRVNDRRQLLLDTPSGAQIAAAERSDGNFQGTFTKPNGSIVEVTIVRISEEARQQVARAGAALPTDKPGPDVPASCARFFGGWVGGWSVGNIGELRLWVLGIKPDCTAKVWFGSSSSKDVPKSLSATAIKEGILAVPCGDSGKCVFEVHGDDIWASYTNPGGGRNNGVFQKIQ